MRKMALDVGDARVGIAFSDPLGIIAGDGETYRITKDRNKDLRYFAEYAKRKECDLIVVGLPINMDGTEGPRAEKTRTFVEDLARFTDLPIVFQDERWSTVSAEKALIESGMRREKRNDVIDLVAAKIILQSDLDRINKK